ncbi:hypothetical protein V5F41_11455 [Xanthobacter autotrophicus]|uniref:hypothetical protein n=1 Tax=Xanthobacter autotrophicus TaxID=280 RepID=UPI0037261C74
MNIAFEAVLRALGLFYVLSGVLVVRSLAVSAMADATYSAIVGTPTHPAERAREIWLAAGSVLIGVGGLALVLLLDVAAVLFILGAIQQLAYLGFIAPRYFDPHDEPDAGGRAKTWNAAIVYVVATALVVAVARGGVLRPWLDAPVWLLVAAGVAIVAGVVWTVRALSVRGSVGKAE